ncbi:hypothetical protein ACFC5Z_23195 [Streptomyces sp. NPDC056004]
MMRVGPAGPEGSRRSDIDDQGPTKTHPTMGEWGNVDHSE